MLWLYYALSKTPYLQQLVFKRRVFSYGKKSTDISIVSPVLAHACATPLTILMCNLEEVLRSENKKNKRLIRESYTAVIRLKNLLTPTQNKIAEFNVKEALHHAVTIFKSKCVATLFSYYEDLDIQLHGNAHAFEEACICLLNNAAEAYVGTHKPKVVVMYAFQQGSNLKIIVEDFGLGMNFFALRLATLAGVSYKPNGKGIGLSFVMATITESFKGTLEFESKLEKGTKITMIIPILDKTAYSQTHELS